MTPLKEGISNVNEMSKTLNELNQKLEKEINDAFDELVKMMNDRRNELVSLKPLQNNKYIVYGSPNFGNNSTFNSNCSNSCKNEIQLNY